MENKRIEKLIIGFIAITFIFVIPVTSSAFGIGSLKKTLLEKGFSPKFINQVSKHFIPLHIVIRKNFYHKESAAQYKHYFSARSIKRITSFYKMHKNLFTNLGKQGVDGTIIASILFVETNFGKQIGGYSVSNVYANIIAFGNKNRAEKRKTNWAIKQMRALQTMWEKGKINVFALTGSWAGAFGISQFIPSSYVAYAVDGNGDGKIDLYNLDDAVASVSNFLIKEGWNRKNRLKTILHYNKSIYYGQTVIKLSNILKHNETTAQ